MTVLKIKQLAHADGLEFPAYATAGSAGMDLLAAVPETTPVVLAPMQRQLIPTGLVIELPADHEAQVRPRSGLAIKHGITLVNSPGTIDEDYRGEVMVPLINLGESEFVIKRGERIAQMIVAPVAKATIVEIETLTSTERGSGGFGSTGQ